MHYRNSEAEERLCQILKAYVEEWGPENVIVSVPADWSEYSTSTLGRVLLEFNTDNSIDVRVEYGNKVMVRFIVTLNPDGTEAPRLENIRFGPEESLETRLFKIALRHLMYFAGCSKQDTVSRELAAYIAKSQAAAPLRKFELQYGRTEPNEIAYWMIQQLISDGLIAESRKTRTLLLTEKGRNWLEPYQSQF